MVNWWTLPLALLVMIAGGVLWLRRVWFYRDPLRVPPEGAGLIIAPADGRIVYIKPFTGGEVVSEKLGTRIPVREITRAAAEHGDCGWIVGIYMSPLDVHYNYAPVEGRISGLFHVQAKINLPMVDMWEYIRLTYLRRAVDLFAHRYRLVNERLTVFIEGNGPVIAMVEIADKFINKISCFVENGQELRPGQKISFIHRGSQVDLVIFSTDVDIRVEVGQQVYGASTVVASYQPQGG